MEQTEQKTRLVPRSISMQKAIVQQALDAFTEEVDVDEFFEKIYLLRKIELGEQQISAGELISHEDVKKRLEKWLA